MMYTYTMCSLNLWVFFIWKIHTQLQSDVYNFKWLCLTMNKFYVQLCGYNISIV